MELCKPRSGISQAELSRFLKGMCSPRQLLHTWLKPVKGPRSGFLALVIGLALGLTNCSPANNQLSTQAPPTLAVAQGTTEAAIVQNWITYSPTTGKYTARFPTQPQESTTTADIAADQTKQVFLAVYEAEDKTYALAVSYSEMAPEVQSSSLPQDPLEQAQIGIANGIDAEVISSTPIQQGAYPGREVVFESIDKFQAKARIIYAKGILYQLVVVAQDDNPQDPRLTAFLDSVVLTP